MMNLVLMIGTSELLLIAALVLLLFGGKKLPEMMKGLGQGVRSFKDGMKEVTDLDEGVPASETSQNASDKKESSIEQVENNGK